MIVDCFIFYNEIKLLQYRLETLYKHVDHFIIVESTLTFAGNKKESYFLNNKHLFEKFLDKIIHVLVNDTPVCHDAWGRERFQRNCISRGLDKIVNLKESDVLIISDCDEIPNVDILKDVHTYVNNKSPIKSLQQDLYYYSVNCQMGQ